jgi:hypothetical protein
VIPGAGIFDSQRSRHRTLISKQMELVNSKL